MDPSLKLKISGFFGRVHKVETLEELERLKREATELENLLDESAARPRGIMIGFQKPIDRKRELQQITMRMVLEAVAAELPVHEDSVFPLRNTIVNRSYKPELKTPAKRPHWRQHERW